MTNGPADTIHSSALAVTMGEPAGVGPEVIIKAWLERNRQKLPPFYVIGDAGCLADTARDAGLAIALTETVPENTIEHFSRALPIVQAGIATKGTPGLIDPDDAKLVSDSIVQAVEHVLTGRAAGIVTAPINKKALYDSGFSYPGHTEFLGALVAEHTGTEATPVMMLAGPELRTVPVTIHIPLAKVIAELSTEKIVTCGRIAASDLKKWFSIENPRLAVSGLNPHAGENGAMGTEDREIIAPAIIALQAEGFDVTGPLPADTMFHASARGAYDVALCMYHDQALIPAKTLAFDEAVNVTLGLPFIRTSPDHGTALDIAGQGKANASSMIAAIKMAGKMVAAGNAA